MQTNMIDKGEQKGQKMFSVAVLVFLQPFSVGFQVPSCSRCHHHRSAQTRDPLVNIVQKSQKERVCGLAAYVRRMIDSLFLLVSLSFEF